MSVITDFGNVPMTTNNNVSREPWLAQVFGANSTHSNDLSSTDLPYGNTYRGPLANVFNGKNVSNEDWIREQQSATNDYLRQLDLMNRSNAFNAQEAQKQRDFEAEMSNTAYSRAVKDMKNAGINPIMLYGNHAASTPQGVSASNTMGAASFGKGSRHKSGQADGAIVGFLADVAGMAISLLSKKPTFGFGK